MPAPVLNPEEIVTRDFPVLELRVLEENEIEGYANIFNVVDAYNTIWERGVFKKGLRDHGDRVRLLWAHDTREPLGKLSVIREDKKGLFFRGKVSDTATGRDVMTLIRDGAVEDVSIGFRIKRMIEDKDDPDNGPMHMVEADVLEVSPVSLGAVPGAEIKGFREEPNGARVGEEETPETSTDDTLDFHLNSVHTIVEAIEARVQEESLTNEQRDQLRGVAERLVMVARPARQLQRELRARVLEQEIKQI